MWNVFRPWQNARLDGLVEGRGLAQARIALVAFYLYAAAAIVGLVALRRRRHPIWPYLVLVAVVDVHGVDLVRGAALPHSRRRGAACARRVGIDAMSRRATRYHCTGETTAPSSTSASRR